MDWAPCAPVFSCTRLFQGAARAWVCPQTPSLRTGTGHGSPFPAQSILPPPNPRLPPSQMADPLVPFLIIPPTPAFSLHWGGGRTPLPFPALPTSSIHQQHSKLCYSSSELLK